MTVAELQKKALDCSTELFAQRTAMAQQQLHLSQQLGQMAQLGINEVSTNAEGALQAYFDACEEATGSIGKMLAALQNALSALEDTVPVIDQPEE